MSDGAPGATAGPAPGGRQSENRRPRALTRGVLAAVLLFAVLGGLGTLSAPPFVSADESAHAAYGLTLYQEGRLPTLFETVEPVFPLQVAKPQHVANHPPLFYVLTGPFLAAGAGSGHLLAGYLAARSLSTLASMVTVLLVAAFAHALLEGRRPAVSLGAAALTAVHAPFVSVSGVLHNDALGVALAAAVLWLVVRVVRQGPSPGLVAALALTALAGTAVRASNASLVAIASLAVLVAALAHAPADVRWGRGLRRGLVTAFLVGGTSLAGIGWFFVRNIQLYGNALGYGVLEEAFGKTPRTESFFLLRHPDLVLRQLGLPTSGAALTVAGLPTVVLVVAVLGGLAVGLWGRNRAPLPERDGGGAVSERTVRRLLAGLFLLHALITVVMVIRHVDGGGGIHVRYLFPLLPIVATIAAAALFRLPSGRRGAGVVAAVLAGVVATVNTLGRSAWRWEPDRDAGAALVGIVRGLTRLGIPQPTLVLSVGLVAVAAAVLVVAVSLWRLGPAGSATAAGPTGPGSDGTGSGAASGSQAPPQATEDEPRPALA
jgi:hypothetical protein